MFAGDIRFCDEAITKDVLERNRAFENLGSISKERNEG